MAQQHVAGSAAIYASDGARSIPQAGDVHPSMPGFRVRGVSVRPVYQSRTDVWLTLHYVKTRRRLLDIRQSGLNISTETDFDRFGEVLVVGYREPGMDGKPIPADTQFPLPPK